MTKYIILALVLGGLGLTAIKPIYLPDEMIQGISDFANSIWAFNNFIPVTALFNCISIDIFIIIGIVIFKLLFGLVAGKPEID